MAYSPSRDAGGGTSLSVAASLSASAPGSALRDVENAASAPASS